MLEYSIISTVEIRNSYYLMITPKAKLVTVIPCFNTIRHITEVATMTVQYVGEVILEEPE